MKKLIFGLMFMSMMLTMSVAAGTSSDPKTKDSFSLSEADVGFVDQSIENEYCIEKNGSFAPDFIQAVNLSKDGYKQGLVGSTVFKGNGMIKDLTIDFSACRFWRPRNVNSHLSYNFSLKTKNSPDLRHDTKTVTSLYSK